MVGTEYKKAIAVYPVCPGVDLLNISSPIEARERVMRDGRGIKKTDRQTEKK